MTSFRTLAGVAALGAFMAACSPAPQTAGEPAPAPETVAVAADEGPLPLPLPINAIMVSLVDFAADGVWRPAAQETPLSDKQWLYIQQDATNLVASATLMTTEGTGANDSEWVKDPNWRLMTREFQSVALQAKSAADSKDQALLKLAGDRLVELCESCHKQYKPGLPAMGITRFPIYPKRDDQTP